MCICINCRHVNACTTYKVIQQQHGEYIKQTKNFFIPNNTLITVSINQSNNLYSFDWDLIECLSFTEQPGKWLH